MFSSAEEFSPSAALLAVGIGNDEEAANVLAPGAQLGRFAFESCLTLTSITFAMDHTNKPRTLPDGSFCGAGIESLCLPGDFHNIGPRACENCKRLVEVNLMRADITVILNSTFAHCVALSDVWLPPRLRQIGKEAFLSCISLREVVIPTELQDIGIRAFCGCEQLVRFTPLDWGEVHRTIQAERNAFLMCDHFERASGVELLPQGNLTLMLLTESSSWTGSKAADLGECLSTCPGGGAPSGLTQPLRRRGGYTTPHAIRLIKVVRT